MLAAARRRPADRPARCSASGSRTPASTKRSAAPPILLELSQEVATAAHAEYYARIVRDKAVLRSLIHASTDIIHDAYDPTVDAREMLARAEERVFRILDTKGDNAGPPRSATCCTRRWPASTPACSTSTPTAASKPASSTSTS